MGTISPSISIRTVFVFEFLTGGGCWSLGNEPPSGSLLTEGRAMRDAIAADFAAIDNVESVWLLHDERLPPPTIPKQRFYDVNSKINELRLFEELALKADATLIIAPEFSDHLLHRAQIAERIGARLISPTPDFIQLASDKNQTSDYLVAHGIPVPRGVRCTKDQPMLDPSWFPAVLKPSDGCGSLQVRRLETAAELCDIDLSQSEGWRLERFHPGTAVSVAILSGPPRSPDLKAQLSNLRVLALQPCRQKLSDDGLFTYQGGSTPLPPHLAERATSLAIRTAQALPTTIGYFGIDIVLGGAKNGSDDVVIEINPRLTTSYLGLRAACHQNLAEVMWQWAQGEPTPVTFREQHLEFTADGLLRTHP